MLDDDTDTMPAGVSTQLVPVDRYRQLPLPDLPSSSGAWGTRLRILGKNGEYVRLHADFLNARVAQAHAMGALIEARIGVALTLSMLAHLDEIVATEYLKSRRKRASELRLVHLQCETAEVNAEISLTAARKQLTNLNPLPAPATAPPADAGLTPAEVDELVSTLPEISEETRRTLSLLVSGRLSEKKK